MRASPTTIQATARWPRKSWASGTSRAGFPRLSKPSARSKPMTRASKSRMRFTKRASTLSTRRNNGVTTKPLSEKKERRITHPDATYVRNTSGRKRKVAGCGRGDKMTDRITRRDALKLGTSAAVSATVSPLIRSITDHVSSVNRASSTLPDSESTVMPPTTEDEICFMRARDLAGTIRDKKISAREVMQAHLKQIARVNPKVNAIVTLVPEEQLMAQALAADEALAKGTVTGP